MVTAWPSIDSRKYISSTFLCLFLIMISLQAQQNQIDSLRTVLENHEVKDTTRVNLLNDLAFSCLNSDLAKSLEYLNESNALANDISYKKGKARSLYINGLVHSSKSNNEQAIELFEKSLVLYEEEGFESSISQCYAAIGLSFYHENEYNKAINSYGKSINIDKRLGQSPKTAVSLKYIGFCYLDMGEYEKALEYLKNAMTLNKEHNDRLEMSSCLNNIGSIYLHQGNYPFALEHYNKSLSIYKTLKDSAGISSVLNNIGILHKNQGNYEKAINAFEKGLKIGEKIGNKNYLVEISNSLGLLFKKKKNYEKAHRFLNEALAQSEDINNKFYIGTILNNIGEVYEESGDYSAALQCFEKGKKINLEIRNQRSLCNSYLGLAKIYSYQKRYDNALGNIQKSKDLSSKLQLLEYQRDAYNLLFIIYQNTGNYKKAFESHQQFKILNDSLFNKENIEKIAQLEYEYKYKQALDSASIRELKLNKTILSTSQDLAKTKQNYLWAVIGILGTSILSGSFVFYQKYKSVKIRNQNIVTEQKLLRSQMTPHFIFNSLSVLQGMILNKEEQKSITYLSKFSKLLRIVLENSRDKVVPLIQELDAIDNYMMLQNLDADPPYDYSLIVDENIDINQFLVPPMLIQPFIENAIEHAFTTDQEHREIGVHLTFEHKKLRCTITDNGIGIDAISNKTNIKKKSLATTITKERLEMLAKDFKMAGSITIADRKKDKERGTRVTLLVPYKLNSNV